MGVEEAMPGIWAAGRITGGVGAPSPETVIDRWEVALGDSLHGWNVLLWNDDVHSMDYVVRALMHALELSADRAVQVMLEAHTRGKAVAWTGAKEVAEMYRDRLEARRLTATVGK
jgi:ATP-dependent Clp protease adaptor protein ClpS